MPNSKPTMLTENGIKTLRVIALMDSDINKEHPIMLLNGMVVNVTRRVALVMLEIHDQEPDLIFDQMEEMPLFLLLNVYADIILLLQAQAS